MRHIVRLAIFFAIFSIAPAAFAQAAAETVLLHGNVTGATAKSGTALGKAINKASSQVSNKVHTTTQQSVESGMTFQVERTPLRQTTPTTNSQATSTTQAAATPAHNSMIVSMQGGRVTRPIVPKSGASQTADKNATQNN
jgi:hypothetical protein